MEFSEKEAGLLLNGLTSTTIAFKPIYLKITGSIECALLLSQFRFWEKTSSDGWVNKTQHFIEQVTGISPKKQDTAKKKLISLGLLDSDTYYGDFYPRQIYKINKKALVSLIMEHEKKIKDLDIFDDGSKIGNIYFMRSNKNFFIKIGFTKNDPKYREKTLQSEDPCVDLAMYIKNATMQHEKMLHDLVKDKRVRGEWFDLNDDDLTKVINFIWENINWNEDDWVSCGKAAAA